MIQTVIKAPIKNEYWRDYTPNNHFNRDEGYKALATSWAREHNIKGPYKFLEVRVTKTISSHIITREDDNWWADPLFMDAIFWVYHKPTNINVDGELKGFYWLEPIECARVVTTFEDYRHKDLGYKKAPALVIPTDCCEIAWEETSNGYSDHIRDKAKEMIAAENELVRSEGLEDQVQEIEKNIVDINSELLGDTADRALQLEQANNKKY